ncbi:MAG TPA: bifunctional ADP-heptose synthase [Candidatus Acidoferrum sp.]|nr:bifunctional ADP-heptose synthase [Candidatus Acidoferrum sp.]
MGKGDIAGSVPRLRRLIPRLRGRRVGVLGDLMLDRYLWGTATRLSPEAAVPVVDFEKQEQFPGGAGNVAANLAALGAKVEAFGVVGGGKSGEDDAGRALRSCLRDREISDGGIVLDATRVSTVKTRIIARHQQIVRVDHERKDVLNQETEDRVFRRFAGAVKKLEGLVLSDYDKGVITDSLSEKVMGLCNREGVPVFVSPKRPRLFAHRGARVVTCNLTEAARFVTRPLEDETAIAEALKNLLSHFGAGAVVITRGGDGMSVLEEGAKKPHRIAATSFEVTYARVGQSGIVHGASGRQVFDVTGAGDTVLSVLALAVTAGASLTDAAVLANTAAGVVVGKLGTATVSSQELEHALNELHS